ncbi:MAG: adenylosuccinate lyase [Chlamydiae bacterium RIFCSPHIGHO2_12_FULL_49_9]|nr:MAG: adenylosuccinate lyase [Chlamydiae bacterium RIFCSPHIGHO2_12_FULL_49_9]
MTNAARHEEYVSPFSARYASKEMSHLFSDHFRASTFRRLWISLARAQQTLGLPIQQTQIAQMEGQVENINFEAVKEYEKRFRHDVMAHIHAYGDLCPDAKKIIHLGATSCYVTDNADLIQLKKAIRLLLDKLIAVLKNLSAFAETEAKTACLSYTHYQTAQPTTVGKRACLWLQDLLLDAREWERIEHSLPFLGAKGATGTQASFLSLFEGDHSKVQKLETLIAKDFGFAKTLPISGQTYSRKLDLNCLNALESFAASVHKMATDIRLLAHDGELSEAFGKEQVGSSAMPFKKNPIYSERICGIARFVISLAQNPAYTTATQWLERSLDDSSNRRLSIPEAFLGVDAILNILSHLVSSLRVDREIVHSNLEKNLPFLVMENLLMHAVKKGGNRQTLHEKLRQIALHAQKHSHPLSHLKTEVEKDKEFHASPQELNSLLNVSFLIGRAPEQVADFLQNEVQPFLAKHKNSSVTIPSVEI